MTSVAVTMSKFHNDITIIEVNILAIAYVYNLFQYYWEGKYAICLINFQYSRRKAGCLGIVTCHRTKKDILLVYGC